MKRSIFAFLFSLLFMSCSFAGSVPYQSVQIVNTTRYIIKFVQYYGPDDKTALIDVINPNSTVTFDPAKLPIVWSTDPNIDRKAQIAVFAVDPASQNGVTQITIGNMVFEGNETSFGYWDNPFIYGIYNDGKPNSQALYKIVFISSF